MEIRQILDSGEKQKITCSVLESLKDWFGITQARENYIAESGNKIFFCAFEGINPVGFLYLKETGNATVELYVMGVLKEFHRKGIGRELFLSAKKCAMEKGYSFIQVKTVQMGKYEEYDRVNKFYISLGFKEFEMFPKFWNKRNPCQIYIMSLR